MNFLRSGLAAILVVAALAATASAQDPDTLNGAFTGHLRSTWEEYYLSLFHQDTLAPGARSAGMGGAGLALRGGAASYALNPTAILGLTTVQVEAGGAAYLGSAGVRSFPDTLVAGPGAVFQTSNYRVHPLAELDYAHASLGIPLTLLGNRGAVALSYRRIARTGQGDETRAELRGDITQGSDATFGVGNKTGGGLDAISFAVARSITPWLDLGATANWQSGTLKYSQDLGVSAIGFVLFTGGTAAKQDVSAFSLDVGARVDAGPVTLAGTALLPHRLHFRKGSATIDPLPDPTNPESGIHIQSRPLDHDQFIPLRLGFGAAVEPVRRLTVAGDYWYFNWKRSRIHREGLTPVFGFENPSDPTTFRFALLPGGPEEAFNAGLDNTHSVRLGVEYRLVEKATFGLPVRIGYRKEKLALNNYETPSWFTDRNGDGLLNLGGDLVGPYWQALQAGDQAAAAELAGRLSDLLEHNNLLFRGKPVDSSTITLGVGAEIREFTANLGFERQSYDVTRFFLNAFDPLLGPSVTSAEESRTITRFTMSLGMRY